MSVQRIRKNDVVIAAAGANAGTTGKVLQVLGDRVLVEGVNLRKKTLRKTQENPKGGITEKEIPVAMSNLMPYCPDCKKGVRLTRDRDNDRSVRKCRQCGHEFDR